MPDRGGGGGVILQWAVDSQIGFAFAQALDRLAPGTQEIIAELAAAPDMIRGYEQIKLDNVERYRQRTEELLGLLTAQAPAGGVRV